MVLDLDKNIIGCITIYMIFIEILKTKIFLKVYKYRIYIIIYNPQIYYTLR